MFGIKRSAVPQHALLRTHGGRHPERWGGYQDCFRVRISGSISLAEFVFAFYTSRVFKLERLLLRTFLGIRSSDEDAQTLIAGTTDTFAAWYQGARTPSELLMCDRFESTRSWFMVEPVAGGASELCFGSAVASGLGRSAMPSRFRLLLVFHVLYSQVLLHSAVRGLVRGESLKAPLN
ncbi:MAG TPA: hypothetical protein VGI93_02950 [Steroidobacteraceae bacterium]